MEISANELTVIVPEVAVSSDQAEDGGSGETYMERTSPRRLLGVEQTVDLDKASQSLKRSMSQVSQLLKDLEHQTAEGWALETITVSLSMSAGGTIGVATVGVEGGIQVSFRRNSPPSKPGETHWD